MNIRDFKYGLVLLMLVFTTSTQAHDEIVKKIFTASYHTFSIVNNLIVVEAEVSGKVGKYILDTGSSGLVLNSEHHSKDNGAIGCSIIGAGGTNQKSFQNQVSNFRFGHIVKRKITAAYISLAHLESSMDMVLDGLIGMKVLQEAALIIDYDAQIIKLADPESDYASANAKLDLKFVSGVPVIEAQFNGLPVNLAIDFGASSSIIDQSIAQAFDLKVVEQIDLLTANGKIETLNKVQCNDILLDDSFLFQTEAIITDLSHLQNEGQAIQGVIGIDLLRSYKVMINPSTSQLYLWSAKPTASLYK